MVDQDPLRDLERRLDRLENRVDLSDQAVRSDIEGMRADLRRLESADERYVPLMRYQPVERIVYGMVTLILSTVVLAVVAIVVNGGA